ncbi:MAG: M48 family metallopeptidase, partial [Paracoccaceae bacterium]
LAIPVIAIGAGLFLIWQLAPAILGIAFGALLIALGIFLLPRRPKLPDGLLRRADLPQSFAMLDEICAQLATPAITGIAIDTSFNAYVTEIGRERILGFGVIMWAALNDDQRLAVLGHEVAHLVNGDPARRGLIARLIRTVKRRAMREVAWGE